MNNDSVTKDPRSAGTHPSENDLVAFGLGRCDDAVADAIERHVLECDSCCQRLAEIPDDPLLDKLRGPDVHPDTNLHIGETDAGTGGSRPGHSQSDVVSALQSHPKYELIRRIGEGGMGVVYLVRHRIMDRPVALKVISPRMGLNPDARARFEREIQIVAKLSHPNIVAAFDAEMIGGHLCLVSEYFESESLDAKITRPPIDFSTAGKLVRQAAVGLEHAHQHGLIHRDIKPHNILVSNSGQVKVVDFGLASYAESDNPSQRGLTSAGVIVGTPDYISPEQAREGTVDRRADIYSLGCTLYHLICGRPPFEGSSRVEKLSQHLQSNPKPIHSFRPDVPRGLEACVAKMMAKDPAARFQSAGDVVEAISPYCSDLPSVTPVPRRTATARRVRPRFPSHAVRRGVLATLIAALLVGGGVAGRKYLDSGGNEEQARRSGGERLVLGSSIDSGAPIDPVWSERPIRLLAVAPKNVLGRDRHNLYQALDELGVRYDLRWSTNETLPTGSSKVVGLDHADPRDFDAVVFLGPDENVDTELTAGPTRPKVERLVESIRNSGQPLACFGTGIWTLGRIGALRGRNVANCVHSTAAFKKESGAAWVDGETLVVDDDLVSGTNTSDAKPFLKVLMKIILEG